MAKKVKITDYYNSQVKESNKKKDLVKLFSLIINVILVVVVVVILIISNNTQTDLQDEIDSIDTSCAYKYEISCTMNYSDEIEKARMLDDNIVFVLEGYGNIYYTYDCVSKLTAGNQYSYWAYNKEAAISKGYKAGKC